MDDQSKRIWQGAVVLALAMIIVKVLSVVYRIPYQNITGDTGFYVFQQVYPFYGIASTFALAGFPVALSRILSESGEVAEHRNKRIQEAFTTFMAVGVILFVLLFFGSSLIAGWMGDSRLQPPIQATSFIYLFVPFVAVFRGIFQGAEQMKPTAYSQVVEQSVRVVCIIGFSYYFMSRGYSVYTAGAAATSGSVVGAMAGLVVLFLFFRKEQKERRGIQPRLTLPGKGSVQLLSAGLLLSLCSMILLLFQLADAFTFVNFLSKSGIAIEHARKIKGIFDRAQPLLQLGTVIATSLSLAAVPAVAAAKRRGDAAGLRKICGLSIKVVFIIGLAAAAGLAVIIEPVNTMLFENKEGSLEIAVLGLSILPVSMFLTSTGLLQGLGMTAYPVVSVVLAFISKIAGNAVLMPAFHEIGASTATVLASSLAAGVNLVFLEKRTRFAAEERFYGMRIGSAVALMALAAWLVKSGLAAALPETRTASAMVSLGASAVGGIVLLAALLLARVFNMDDLMRIPKLQKIRHVMSRWKERRS
ncbi:putative polysaccharide biosynthesis protein [Fictibacillus fluitans]|uniref:Polysaccharide biosynthesis protein n=1 Tax=Fictibacillus fluitans TaxID=3058422 RepID=A0ABT8I385_9BACL|nr:polysaccharide biosynthesis protein [Fictibacillus sp. NE201]MDN4527451.1 polysaccharide biosynthesis protein [Fictibacillus sp. NE201]